MLFNFQIIKKKNDNKFYFLIFLIAISETSSNVIDSSLFLFKVFFSLYNTYKTTFHPPVTFNEYPPIRCPSIIPLKVSISTSSGDSNCLGGEGNSNFPSAISLDFSEDNFLIFYN